MGVINQQSDTRRFGGILSVELDAVRPLLLSLFLEQFLVEFD